MKKLLLILLCLPFIGFGQTEYRTKKVRTIVDITGKRISTKDGKRDGPLIIYYETGELASEYNYNDGWLNGIYKWYYKNGQLWSEGYYKDGIHEGLHKDYHYNGQLASEGGYKDDLEEGLHKDYHYNGQLESEGYYKDGLEEGLRKSYYEDGQLESEGYYKDGKPDGFWVWCNKTVDGGHILCCDELYYIDGKPHGLMQFFYKKTGKLGCEANMVNGEFRGLIKIYDINGQLILEGNEEQFEELNFFE